VRPGGATWRSGYAAVCKTVYTSSILVVASIFKINGLGRIVEARHEGAFTPGERMGGPTRRGKPPSCVAECAGRVQSSPGFFPTTLGRLHSAVWRPFLF
jgi:hypothetical protein